MNTLEETLCDSLLSFHWRRQVYKSIKQFKPIMFEVLSDKEYEAFNHRLNLHADYFLDLTDSTQALHTDDVNGRSNDKNVIDR